MCIFGFHYGILHASVVLYYLRTLFSMWIQFKLPRVLLEDAFLGQLLFITVKTNGFLLPVLILRCTVWKKSDRAKKKSNYRLAIFFSLLIIFKAFVYKSNILDSTSQLVG